MTYSPAPSRSPVMLAVEDDADDQRFLQWALRKHGLDVTLHVAEDGDEAIRILSRPPERLFLILTDVHLPKKSGWDVLQWIRSRPPWSHLPVLVWTSLPNPEGALRAQQLGATSYLSKPVTSEGYRNLISMISQYLRD